MANVKTFDDFINGLTKEDLEIIAESIKNRIPRNKGDKKSRLEKVLGKVNDNLSKMK